MEIDIKCTECGKMTRNFELGKLFYIPNHVKESVVILDAVICPKCKKDISNEKFLVKESYFFMRLITANVCLSMGETPDHLRVALPVFNQGEYAILKEKCKSRPTFVMKF